MIKLISSSGKNKNSFSINKVAVSFKKFFISATYLSLFQKREQKDIKTYSRFSSSNPSFCSPFCERQNFSFSKQT